MGFDLKTATPVIERNDGSIEPTESIDLSNAVAVVGSLPVDGSPVVSGQRTFSVSPSDDVQSLDRPDVQSLDAPAVTVEFLMGMPILGGFSPKQLDHGFDAIDLLTSKERSKAFKWLVLGMPTDMEGINKAENMSWAELAYESPIIDDVREAIGDAADFTFRGVTHLPPPFKIPEGITKETLKNLPIELTGTMTEFFSDPVALLTAQALGYGFKQVPRLLKILEYKNPALYQILTTEIFANKDSLKWAYDVLDLKPNATGTQINKTYRLKSLRTHTDRGGGLPEAQRVQVAYDVINKSRDTIFKQIVRMYKGTGLGKKLKSQRGSIGPVRGGKAPKTVSTALAKQAKGFDKVEEFVKGELGSSYADINQTSPDESVIVYRASEKGGKIKEGDFVTTNRQQASFFARDIVGQRGAKEAKIVSQKVNAGDIRLKKSQEAIGVNDAFIYRPQQQLTDIFNKAKQPVDADVDGSKERGFITSIKEELPNVKVAGQYIPRPTDELSKKARQLIKDDTVAAEKKAMTGTDDASIATGAELLRHYSSEADKLGGSAKDALYEKAAELGNSMAERLTELGRSVQAASILSWLTPEGQVRFAAKTIQRHNENVAKKRGGLFGLQKEIPELTPEQVKDIMTRMKDLQKMPEGQQKAIMFRELQNDITDLTPTPIMDKIVTIWKAGLLTGIRTSGVNIFSNISHLASETVKDIPATLVDMATSKFTGKRSVAFTARGVLKGLKEGADRGWQFLQTGYDERNVLSKYDYKRVNMGSGKVAKGIQAYEEAVFKILGAEDQPFYYGAKMRSLYEQAKVQAINKGLKGQKASDFIDNLVMNPTDEMALLSVEDAKIAVYQNETSLGNLAKGIQNLSPLAHFILPFGRTPSAVATQILNYSPAGIAKTVINNIGSGRFNQRDFSKGFGRGLTGTAILGIGAYLFNKGLINLDHPTTESERKLWELEGRKANTIKIGGKYRQVQSLGPFGNVLLVGGHFAKAYKDTGSVTGALVQGSFGAIKSFTEQTFLQSLNMVMSAVNDPERSAMRFINSFVASFVPTIVKDIAVATDPKLRVTNTTLARVISRVPVLRQILEPRVDVLGREITRAENFAETMLDFTRPSTMRNDPIVNELRRLKSEGNAIHTTKLGTRSGFASLTPQENTQLWKESGQNAYTKIVEFVTDDSYDIIPDDVKSKRINKFIDDSKNSARIAMAIQKTENLEDEELREKLSDMVEDGLLTRELFNKYLRMR